jgi:hypothetical protein
MVVYVFVGAVTTDFGALALLFADAVDTRPRIDVVIDSPVRAFATVGKRAGDFLKARVERQIMADRVLEKAVSQKLP